MDYVIVPTDNLQIVQKMEIDEGKQWTPYRILKEKNETRQIFTDHRAIMVEANWIVEYQEKQEKEKKMHRVHREKENARYRVRQNKREYQCYCKKKTKLSSKDTRDDRKE